MKKGKNYEVLWVKVVPIIVSTLYETSKWVPAKILKIFMSRLPKHPPPQFVDFKMPSSLFLVLVYSACCPDTYYPDNFGSLVPFINHIMLRVMKCCSFAHIMSVNCSFTPTRLCLYCSNTSPL